ncbi:septum formation inhibitor-activating ATPase [Aurantiacibacter odishensis]|uniref:septum formation inhibitor-activating ATPase n=1 Tax=Aurantiacibacter odishensis TaxID=1155476 RepID=UPI000E7704B5|nr:septum formation inhibitor-activating ATPase [Aurantiacibacter odishensis]
MNLDELISASDAAMAARLVDPSKIDIGGVDPLGLRQINFDMMDQVLPGLNNVARHVRPYLLMTWAWRRAGVLNERLGPRSVGELRDFVDRIETIYAWSQFLIDDETDLPGGQALAGLIQSETYTFGGEAWEKFRNVRRYSTGLIAAVNYGPSLRTMNWIADLADLEDSTVNQRGAYKANPQADPGLELALQQFEASFSDALPHPAFNEFGAVTVTREEAKAWGQMWRMKDVTPEGKQAAWTRVNSGYGGEVRKRGLQLVRFAATYGTNSVNEEERVRRIMSDPSGVPFPDELKPYAIAWRRMQVRQVFRLALEGLLTWTQLALVDRPLSTRRLASNFIEELGPVSEQGTAQEWCSTFDYSSDPIDHLNSLEQSLDDQVGFPLAAMKALRFCVAEAPSEAEGFERSDRLPLIRAAKDWHAWESLTPKAFIGNMIEGWLFAQHTYWSVGRGLQDARSNGKTILRMRIFIDEGGWRLADGYNPGGRPNPTPDRIETALSLLQECGQLDA